MTRLKIVLLFISLFFVRLWSLPSPLPVGWSPESVVRYTTTILEQPEITDTKTIVRSGIWYLTMRGYTEIKPGSRVRFTGLVEPKQQWGKMTRIVMVDPKVEIVGSSWSVRVVLVEWRSRWVAVLQGVLPEPMASLAAGILLGVKAAMPVDFYQALVSTGTLHIVAASGYNVSIVLAVIMGIALKVVSRGWAIVLGIFGVVAYVIVAGAGASVVRAAIMGSLTLVAYYFGRPTEARRLLWLTAYLMLMIQPLLILDIGFQLSFCATAGLLYLEPWIARLFAKVPNSGPESSEPKQGSELWGHAQAYLSEYLYPTLAASIATLPVILWHFGRVSWISPLVNMLVLPFVPLIMGLTAVIIVLGMVLPGLGQLMAWLLYPVLWWMVRVIRLFG